MKQAKNTFKKATFNLLIYRKNNIFRGICRETGYVEEGSSKDEVYKKLE